MFTEEEIVTVDVSSDEEMVGGPGLGFEAERSSRTPDLRSRIDPAEMARRMEVRQASAPPSSRRSCPNHSIQEVFTITTNRGSSPLL